MGFLLLLVIAMLGATSGCREKSPPLPKNFTLVELNASDGDLNSLLKTEAKKAKKAGRTAFVEFYADWCGPCRALRKSLDDPLMIDAFDGTYIILLDSDAWESKLPGTGFSNRAIPVFFEIDEDGKPTGRTINGGAWGEDTASSMAPPLKKFFRDSAQAAG